MASLPNKAICLSQSDYKEIMSFQNVWVVYITMNVCVCVRCVWCVCGVLSVWCAECVVC